MSNSRVFDYAEVSNLYNQMNTITGDKSDPTSIAGILDKINIDYTDVVHGVVGEDEMAIFGELLGIDWKKKFNEKEWWNND